MEKTNKKFKIDKKAVIIAGIILFCLIMPKITLAADLLADVLGSIGKDILMTLGEVIHWILNWILKAAAALFEGMLNIGFKKSTLDIMKIGWKTCRDFANMFFILFMVIIAFATILRLEQYGIKKLLPKVIGVALLINFSLVFCSIIIDFSNITADFFIKDIKGKIAGGGENSISATFADAFNIGGIYRTYATCEEMRDTEKKYCEGGFFGGALTGAIIPGVGPLVGGVIGEIKKGNCLGQIDKLFKQCKASNDTTVKSKDKTGTDFLNIILGIIVGSIIMLIAAFTLFAGAIMLLFRIIAIWFLVTISPLVFLCYIMPGLKANWQKWWKTFLNWCIFAPAYAFFIWIAIQIAVTGANKNIGEEAAVEGIAVPGVWQGGGANAFVANPGAQLISYFVIIGFLIGGLIVAKNLGIYGANTVMAIGQKWGKGARDWAKRTTMKPVTLAGAGALGLTGKLFGGRLGGRMQAKSLQMKRAITQTKENKAYEQLLNTMTDEQRLNEVKTALGARKLLAVQKAQAIGLLQKTEDRDAVRTGIDTLRGYGFGKEAGDLEEARFSAIKDKTKRKEIARKVKAKNIHKELRPVVFKGAAGYEAAADFASLEPTVSAAIETAKQMRTDTQKEYARGLLASFINNNDFADKENVKLRSIYAALTGALHHAFRDGQTGLPNTAALETFVKGMKPRDFTEIDPHSIPYIAEFVETTTANDIGRTISTATKQAFIRKWQALAMDPNTHAKFDGLLTDLKLNPNWKSLIP